MRCKGEVKVRLWTTLRLSRAPVCIALSFLLLVATVAKLRADDQELQHLVDTMQFMENALKRNAGAACRIGADGQVRSSQDSSAEFSLSPALVCPQLNQTNRDAWIAMLEAQLTFKRHVFAVLDKTPGAYAGQLRSISAQLHRAAWGMSCGYLRAGADTSNEALETLRNVQDWAEHFGETQRVTSVRAWSQLIKAMAKVRAAQPEMTDICRSVPARTAPTTDTSQNAATRDEPAKATASARRPLPTDALDPSEPSRTASAARGTAANIPDATWRAMQGKSWHKGFGCPSRRKLALLTIPYKDFDGRCRIGEMIVARSVASDILDVFAKLYNGDFRIARMDLVHEFGGDDPRSMSANNTSAFNCRRVTGGRRLSEHSYGKAIDINPVQNPYVRRGRTQPRAGRAYDTPAERLRKRLGVIRRRGVAERAFRSIGWTWGGNWRSLKDYQHFSQSGR